MKVKELVWKNSKEYKQAVESWIDPNKYTLSELQQKIKDLSYGIFLFFKI